MTLKKKYLLISLLIVAFCFVLFASVNPHQVNNPRPVLQAKSPDKVTMKVKRKPHPLLNQFQQSYDHVSLERQLNKSLKVAAQEKVYIVIWDPPFGNAVDHGMTDEQRCGLCQISYNKHLVNHPDTRAVVFHFADLLATTMPEIRRLDQYYVWWAMESPSTVRSSNYPMDDYDDVFNLTMSHRQDSDVYSPYGSPSFIMKLVQRNYTSIHQLVKRKTKFALWVVSNCMSTDGAVRRMTLVRNLIAAGLKVDLRGRCFNENTQDIKSGEYKFYLAFENGYHCKDYITEKLYVNALQRGAVPVVFGAPKEDYLVSAPANSFIYAEDFSEKELVNYLNYLDSNDTAYKKYLEWREMDVEKLQDHRRTYDFCQLCRILHGINYDNIFSSNNLVSKYPLFGRIEQDRVVKSLSSWFYGEENEECMLHSSSNWYSNLASNQVWLTAFIFSSNFLHFCFLLKLLLLFVLLIVLQIVCKAHVRVKKLPKLRCMPCFAISMLILCLYNLLLIQKFL